MIPRPTTAALQRRAGLAAQRGCTPRFYALPHNRLVEEGATVRFRCSAAGHPSPWTSWDKDGVQVTPTARISAHEIDDLRTLEIREVRPEDAGLYRIILENDYGRVEATARLDVLKYRGSSRGVRSSSASPRSSPFYSRRLHNTSARVGSRLKLNAELRSYRGGESQWMRDGVPLDSSADSRLTISEKRGSRTLIIEEATASDSGEYACITINEHGVACTVAQVNIQENVNEDIGPKFVEEMMASYSFVEGQVGLLTCRIDNTDIPFSVRWTKDSKTIPDCEDFEYLDFGNGLLGLRFADVFLQDAGRYACKVRALGVTVQCETSIEVEEFSSQCRPCAEFNKQPSPVVSAPGKDVTFIASASPLLFMQNKSDLKKSDEKSNSKHGGLNYNWHVAGEKIENDGHHFVIETVGEESVLRVLNVNHNHCGEIRCTVSANSRPDMRFYDVSCVSQLTVLPSQQYEELDRTSDNEQSFEKLEPQRKPARILNVLTDRAVSKGGSVTLKVEYDGFPEPKIIWFKADRELSASSNTSILGGTSANGTYWSSLTLTKVTDDDSAKYSVSVNNDIGLDGVHVSVSVEGPPYPPAEPPTVTVSGLNSVLVSWKASPFDGGRRILAFVLEKREMSTPNWHIVPSNTNNDIGNGETCEIDLALQREIFGLSPRKRYEFRVRAVNSLGPGEPSPASGPVGLPDKIVPVDFPVALEQGASCQTRYHFGEELGRGRFGVVRRGEDVSTGEIVAVKTIRTARNRDREATLHEIDIMNLLHHKRLLKLLAAYEVDKEITLVTEYVSGGELFERVVADDYSLTECDCAHFMRQICEGVAYMHSRHIVHLDLKPENIMCSSRNPNSHDIKIIDFGLARQLVPGGEPQRVLFGTPEFIPPEVINYEPIGLQSDMWSLGVICYVLLSGLSPFMGDNDAETFANVTRAEYDFDDPAFESVSNEAREFVESLLVKACEKRATAEQCLCRTWLSGSDRAGGTRLKTDRLKKFIVRRKWQLSRTETQGRIRADPRRTA